MGFPEAVRTVLTRKYVTFSGRASRSEYWWFQLFFWLVLGLFVFVGAYVSHATQAAGGASPLSNIITGIGVLLFVAMFLPQIAVTVRRFHDRNISGWWYLGLVVLNVVPIVGYISGLAIFVIALLPGTDGTNKFGPHPLRPKARAEVFA